jgi:flavin-dependent dehydrogenase
VIDDVIIVGAGPAGSVAAALLARAGARVRVLDRSTFPRDKLCGDTVNPGTLSTLRRLGLSGQIEARGLRVEGMRLTGPRGVEVDGRYPNGLYGRALVRRDLDWLLLQHAVADGAQFESRVRVVRAIAHQSGGSRSVSGVVVRTNEGERRLKAPVVIAADGRRSTLAFSLGLAHHPRQPRRWAVGAYYEDVAGVSSLGEMHVRHERYIGVARVPGGAANVCLVQPFGPGDEPLRDPATCLTLAIGRDEALRDRFANARPVTRPVVLGPLAVDVGVQDVGGLILAGDAAGFIDPMTGDGLRFAVSGGMLAAEAALDALAHGWTGVQYRLAEARRRQFRMKTRFNRLLRTLVASPVAVDAATIGARLLPGIFRRMIAVAGDCRLDGSVQAARIR